MNATARTTPVLVWRIVCVVTLGIVLFVYFKLGPRAASCAHALPLAVPLVLFLLSGSGRVFFLPRYKEREKAFTAFRLGVSLAGGCGVMSVFLTPDTKVIGLVLGVLSLVAYVPIFAIPKQG